MPMDQVFTYGTLRKYSVRQMVPGNHEVVADATLRGFNRESDIRLSFDTESVVEGQILSTDRLTKIDNYEGVDSRVYRRVSVPTEAGGEVWMYQYGNDEEATENHIENSEAVIEVQ